METAIKVTVSLTKEQLCKICSDTPLRFNVNIFTPTPEQIREQMLRIVKTKIRRSINVGTFDPIEIEVIVT